MRPCWLCHVDDFFVLSDYYMLHRRVTLPKRITSLIWGPPLPCIQLVPSTAVEQGSWVQAGEALAPPPLFPKKRVLWRVFLRPSHSVRSLGESLHLEKIMSRVLGTKLSLSFDKCKKNYSLTWTISPVSSETRFTDAIIVSSGINASCILMAIMVAAAVFIDIWSASNGRKTKKMVNTV